MDHARFLSLLEGPLDDITVGQAFAMKQQAEVMVRGRKAVFSRLYDLARVSHSSRCLVVKASRESLQIIEAQAKMLLDVDVWMKSRVVASTLLDKEAQAECEIKIRSLMRDVVTGAKRMEVLGYKLESNGLCCEWE
jgi:hypothetical protein